MPTQVVDFGQEADVVDEYVTHPAGYEGILRVTKDAKKIESDGKVSGVEIHGTVDGAGVREYMSRYKDKETGEIGFAAFRVAQVLTAFGLRKHGGPVNPSTLLKITEGKTAKVRLKIHAYGKCKSCGQAGAELANKTECRCGGLIERRERNEVDKWMEPDAGLNVAGSYTPERNKLHPSPPAKTEGGNDADAWG